MPHRQSARKLSPVMPLLSTSTDVMLSHSNVMCLPRNWGAHRSRATNTVTNSKALICNCLAFKDSAPKPTPTAIEASICWQQFIWLSPVWPWNQWHPVYFTRKRLHQSRSALVPFGIAKELVAGVSLNRASKRIVNTSPSRTQAATKFNLPSRLWSSFIEHRCRAS